MINAYEIRGSVVVIQVPYRNYKRNSFLDFETFIDKVDLPIAMSVKKWRARPVNGRQDAAYIITHHPRFGEIGMHSLLFGLTKPLPGIEPDHIDRNPLNNRRSNLRLVCHADNCLNRSRGK